MAAHCGCGGQGGSPGLSKAPPTDHLSAGDPGRLLALPQRGPPQKRQVQCPWELMRKEEAVTVSKCLHWVRMSSRKRPSSFYELQLQSRAAEASWSGSPCQERDSTAPMATNPPSFRNVSRRFRENPRPVQHAPVWLHVVPQGPFPQGVWGALRKPHPPSPALLTWEADGIACSF